MFFLQGICLNPTPTGWFGGQNLFVSCAHYTEYLFQVEEEHPYKIENIQKQLSLKI